MGRLSLLPDSFHAVETWIVRLFLFLGLIAIVPWAIVLLYDLVLYLWRSVTYLVPVVGGRARGRDRPRAPSLTERPSGSRRRFSLVQAVADDSSSRPSSAQERGQSAASGQLRGTAIKEE